MSGGQSGTELSVLGELGGGRSERVQEAGACVRMRPEGLREGVVVGKGTSKRIPGRLPGFPLGSRIDRTYGELAHRRERKEKSG